MEQSFLPGVASLDRKLWRQRFFLSTAMPLKKVRIRGKVRSLLALYRALGLEARHCIVETELGDPVCYRIRLDLHCKHERMALLMNGYEAETARFLCRLFDRSGYFLDVGANIGLITLPFARMTSGTINPATSAPRPYIYCLEPVHSNFETLVYNIALNRMEKTICPLHAGVGEREKRAEISVEGDLSEGSGTGTANILAPENPFKCERIALSITTIDSMVSVTALPANCSLLKLDTDGYDLYALSGARRLLKSARPIVFGEFNAKCLAWHGQTVTDVSRFAGELGYLPFVKNEEGWTFNELLKPECFYQDVLLVPEEKLPLVSWCLS
jgi:FkbM family methyltransferase